MRARRASLVAALSIATFSCTGARSPVAHEDARSASVAFVTMVNGSYRAVCGGVWIDETRIVTAAHCVRSAEVGSTYSIALLDDVENGQVVDAHGARLVVAAKEDDVAVLAVAMPPPHPHAWLPIADAKANAEVREGWLVSHEHGIPFDTESAEVRGDTIDLEPLTGASGSGVFTSDGLVGICVRRATHGAILAPPAALRRALTLAPTTPFAPPELPDVEFE